MRPKASLALILLATGACGHIPDRVRVEVGGQAIELEDRCFCLPPEDDEPHR